MLISSSSSSHRLSNQLNASMPLHNVVLLEQPTTASGSTGDRRLSELYAGAIRQATLTNTGTEILDGIPEDSRFGGWWKQLFNATHSPVFLEWAKSKNIDTSQPITINHYSDTLTVMINGERIDLSGSPHSPGWREATGAIMAAAKAFEPGDIDAPTSSQSAPLIWVARFHGEALLPGYKEETLARATHLEHNQTFDVLGPATYVNVEAQSPEKLEQQKNELGDSTNKFNLLKKLQEISEGRYVALAGALSSKRMPTHPDSTYRQDTQQTEASVEDLLAANGWRVPENHEELDNLIRALAAPALAAPAHGNFGGALAWPEPMSIENQAELFRILADNQPPLPGLDTDARLGSTDLLGALMKQVPRSVLRKGDPNACAQWVLDSAIGQRLGEELKKRLGEVAAQSTAQEVLLTALAVTLDTQSLDEPKLNHVVGFDLAAPAFYGQPLSVIKQGLIDHLMEKAKTTPEATSVAAMLLLSRAAPELLVKDVPASVTYGSFAWLALKSAVGRIEATSPGASAHMTFAEVVAFDAIDPVTEQEEEIQQQTQQSATIEWGKVHGLLPMSGPYTSNQMADTQQAIGTQQQAMLSAISAFVAPLPTQRSVALAELKARFGEGIPFEEKSIRSHVTTTDSHKLTPSITTDPTGSYSLLDLYLAKKSGLGVGWHSSNPKITEEMIKAITTLPDPIKKHEAAFDEYAGNLSQGWSAMTKRLIANLPLENRKNIEWGKLTVYQRGESVRTQVVTPQGGHTSQSFSSLDNDRSLIIKTERNGVTVYYEFDPQRNVMRRRDDWKDNFKEGLQGAEVKTSNSIYSENFTAPAIQRITPSDDDVAKEQESSDGTDFPKSFTSNRSEYLGKLLSDNIISSYRMGEQKDATREVTTFDKEEDNKTFWRNVVLAPIPGGSALYNLAQGNYKDAAADVIFDVVMYATTTGLGKVGGAVKGARAIRRPFGRSLLRGIAQGAESGAQAGTGLLSSAYRGIRSRLGGNVKQSGVRLNQQQARVVAARTDLFEGTAKAPGSSTYHQTIASYDAAKGKWYAYNPVTNTPYGKPLLDFKPSTSTHLDTQWKNRIRAAESGPKSAAFRDGYFNGDPNNVPGYFPGMTSAQVKKLTVNKKLSPSQVGILARQQERIAVQHGLNGANTFNNAVRANGASVTPMPQVFYLSQTQPLSQGQCAALSHLMAEATSKGKAQTLIGNFYSAAANPTSASSKQFIQTLTDLQKKVETPTGFHGTTSNNVKSQPYTAIADNLAESPGSKTLMLGDEGHAMTAGVIVDGNKRSYFFFDPNYGLATFPSVDSLRTGLKEVFTNTNFSRAYKTTGPANKDFEIKISEYDGSTLTKVGANQTAVTSTYMTPLE